MINTEEQGRHWKDILFSHIDGKNSGEYFYNTLKQLKISTFSYRFAGIFKGNAHSEHSNILVSHTLFYF